MGELTLVPEISKLRACGVFTETSNNCRLDRKSRTKCNTSQCGGDRSLRMTEGPLWGESGHVWFEVRKRKICKSQSIKSRNIKRNLKALTQEHAQSDQEDKTDLQRVLAPHRFAIPRRAFYELCFSPISFSPSHIKKDVSRRRPQQVSCQVEIDMGSLSQAAIQDATPNGLQVGLSA